MLEEAFPGLAGPGEGAGLVPEELRFEELRGERPAMKREKSSPASRPGLVDGSRHELLSRARLSPDEHGKLLVAQALDHVVNARDRRGVAGDPVTSNANGRRGLCRERGGAGPFETGGKVQEDREPGVSQISACIAVVPKDRASFAAASNSSFALPNAIRRSSR